MNLRAPLTDSLTRAIGPELQRRRAYVPQKHGAPAGIMKALALMCHTRSARLKSR